MYYRISGAPFTVKNAREKQEFIDVINADHNFAKHLECLGLDAEQFTGEVHSLMVREKGSNHVYAFKCSGNFPTLKLVYKDSQFTHVIMFPVSENGQTVVDSVEEEPKEEETPVEDPTPAAAPKRGRKKKN